MTFPGIPHVFENREDLEDYVERGLNYNGRSPELGVVDKHGNHWFAIRSAPGGDGYAFEFVLVDPDCGVVHVCDGDETGCSATRCGLLNRNRDDFEPPFPVLAWVLRGVEMRDV